MIFSRRRLLATFGLALPAVAAVAIPANATTASTGHKKHKSHHGGATQASHKHRKTPAAAPTTQS